MLVRWKPQLLVLLVVGLLVRQMAGRCCHW